GPERVRLRALQQREPLRQGVRDQHVARDDPARVPEAEREGCLLPGDHLRRPAEGDAEARSRAAEGGLAARHLARRRDDALGRGARRRRGLERRRGRCRGLPGLTRLARLTSRPRLTRLTRRARRAGLPRLRVRTLTRLTGLTGLTRL